MCPTDVGEDITNWLINIRKPNHIKVKWFVTHIREINHSLPFLPPPLKTSRKQEELFAIIKKSIPSFERLFCTNNSRTTITTLNQLGKYYIDLEEVNPPSNNQPHGRENNHQNNRPSNHHHGCVSNNNQIINKNRLTTKMETTSGDTSINQHHIIGLNAKKTPT